MREHCTFCFGFGLLDETAFALLLVLGRVLLEEPEENTGLVLIETFLELGNDWGNFDPGEEDPLLPLEGDVLGPPDKPGEIPLGLDVVADSVVAGFALEQRVSFLLHLLRVSPILASFSLSKSLAYHRYLW